MQEDAILSVFEVVGVDVDAKVVDKEDGMNRGMNDLSGVVYCY